MNDETSDGEVYRRLIRFSGTWDHESASGSVTDPDGKAVIHGFLERWLAKINAGQAACLEMDVIDGLYSADLRYPHIVDVIDLETEIFDQ
jgi:hypothetical protein